MPSSAQLVSLCPDVRMWASALRVTRYWWQCQDVPQSLDSNILILRRKNQCTRIWTSLAFEQGVKTIPTEYEYDRQKRASMQNRWHIGKPSLRQLHDDGRYAGFGGSGRVEMRNQTHRLA